MAAEEILPLLMALWRVSEFTLSNNKHSTDYNGTAKIYLLDIIGTQVQVRNIHRSYMT
jgi:hypothetical protein